MTAKLPPATDEPPQPAKVIGKRLGTSKDSVLNWYRAGKIPGIKINARVVRFPYLQVLAALGLECEEAKA